MSGFTEGKWELGSEGFSGGYCNIYADGESKFIGTVSAEDVGPEEAEANALLIVQAKDLYKIVQELASEFNFRVGAVGFDEPPHPDHDKLCRLQAILAPINLRENGK
ncbi:hypothetical protein [Blastopirellula retiformator]|uniref:Uncharacterized protein n=1 Tax=Blastopirellula retiformator TaxID=2527970 RepID=A0A5C5UWC9_9BACT|nr:hypothetical protein [Blastopirellula retiformator]TWT30684.1 hypothetical protein Enr8_42070 [Blastopirellula retiformator]